MTHRPPTARSEISSAISEDGFSSRPQSSAFAQPPPPTTVSPHGYAHLRGITQPASRSTRSPAPSSGVSGSSRPTSPENVTSRTHIPSITAQGFLRPLSSTRLQQQRLDRLRAGRSPSTNPEQQPNTTIRTEIDDNRSIKSTHTGPVSALPRSHRPAPSITTGYAESEPPDTTDHAAQAEQSSALQALFNNLPGGEKRRSHLPSPLNFNNSLHVGSIRGDQSSIRSPGTFRSGFSIRSKHIFEPGHQQLPSTGTSPHFADHDEKIAQASARARNYEYFEGNKVFALGGRLQNTRDRPINLLTGLLLVLPCILFFVYSASFLWYHVSAAIPVFFAYLFFICFSSFIRGSLTDPGIYPRNIHDVPPRNDQYKDPLEVEKHIDWVMVRLATSKAEAMDVPVKDCKTCNIWRPPRCYHCRVCNSCIDTLDHHCVWLNNCVGRRNYRYFFAFVSSGTVLGLLLAFGSLGHVIAYGHQEGISLKTSIDRNRVPFAMFIYGLLGFAYPVALMGYHLMLMGKGQTTREYLASRRFIKSERYRPFNLGNVFKNWVAVLARPKPPTYMHFKKQYEPGDQRLGTQKIRKTSPPAEEAKRGGMEMKPVAGQAFEGQAGPKPKEAR